MSEQQIKHSKNTHLLNAMFEKVKSDDLSHEIAALRKEIAELRKELQPVPSLIATGKAVVDEFDRIIKKGLR